MEDRKHESPRPLDIVVVGAGMAGLSVAIACQLAGHHVTVFEAAKELKEIGAGLQLTPNGVHIVRRWGVPAWLWETRAEPSSFIVHRYDGRTLIQKDDFNTDLRQRYGAPFLNLHRVDLQLALVERAKELGVQIRLGQRVDDIDLSATQIACASGHMARADLIVAADGLWSKCRSLSTSNIRHPHDDDDDDNDPPLPTGDLAYRIALNLTDITDPELREWVQNPKIRVWIGPGAHAVGYSLRGGTMYNIVLLVPDDLPEHVRRQEGSVREMMSLFEGWDPVLTRFLGMVGEVDKWKLMHRKPLPRWISPESNLVFVGDACHPMLPYLGQGANLAIEDGAVLGLLLREVTCRSQLPRALSIYQQLRKPRGEAVVVETFGQRDAWHLADGPEQEARDAIFHISQPGAGIREPFPSRWICPTVQQWLFGYDAWREVDLALSRRPFASKRKKDSSIVRKVSWAPGSVVRQLRASIVKLARILKKRLVL
ncbi:uncharacterized protein B0I36DRAFT_416676 [Microdochium trichocladiopsis]|uniref:FAD-binding domain-containing protein n=1 Tax=Microdochium trichocladiopsis TaxID=1682393 RepID=A0A9P8XXY9_9PEZI|nr:uncharacterized protein B0I36DRAFT_416676 [Microdochium trichocladiopsis]KAH7024873.1 hypothetical protein B0I36DRAFT_416676 [Microdochium trichocladiopsis]